MAEPAPDAGTHLSVGGGERRASQAEVAPLLSLNGFEGPLDFLVEMVRRQHVDLRRLSIVTLIDQFAAGLEAAQGRVSLERRGDWLVMAASLLLLKAQLLWPATPEAAAQAEADAARRLDLLHALARIRAVTAWLAARPQLGSDLFPRGQPEHAPHQQAALYVAFLEATLVMLEGREGQRLDAPPIYQPTIPNFWRVSDAITRIRQRLALADAQRLDSFLPEPRGNAADRPLQRRAALASTFVAGLELARAGALRLEQEHPFGEVLFAAMTAQSEEVFDL